jgi:hypothetical protein
MMTASGVSSTITSTPAACSKALMLRAVASDDAPFHFFAGQGHNGSGHFGDMFGGDALDRFGDEFARPFFSFFARFGVRSGG